MIPVFVKAVFNKPALRRYALTVLLAAISVVASPQRGGGPVDPARPSNSTQDAGAQAPPDVKLPNGKSQRDTILKAEHEANLKDVAQLVDLAQQLQQDLEKNDAFVLSISTLKKTDDIEKLDKKIRSRLRH